MGPGKVCREHSGLLLPKLCPERQAGQAAMGQDVEERACACWDPSPTAALPGIGGAGTQTGGARKREGPGRGAGKKAPLANPEREPVTGAVSARGGLRGPPRQEARPSCL